VEKNILEFRRIGLAYAFRLWYKYEFSTGALLPESLFFDNRIVEAANLAH
jgi:hypothetical protein